jgi:tartrate-resistant acid phosphatase type 5
MGTYAASNPIDMVLTVGDNFYDDGVQGADDDLWETLWSDVYISPYSALRVPWLSCVGNHDYGYGWDGIKAQMSRGSKDSYWTYPSPVYTARAELGQGSSVLFLVIDTQLLSPADDGAESDMDDSLLSSLTSKAWSAVSEAFQAVGESRARNGGPQWFVVVGHYPILSAGEHGNSNTLVQGLLPLMEKFKVDVYLSGHDHVSEHIRFAHRNSKASTGSGPSGAVPVR